MSLRARLAEAQIAVMLLTRLPAGRIPGTAPGMGASAWAWPLAGFLVGGLSAMGFAGAAVLGLPVMVAALLAVAVAMLATGGMHEDGLADLADGCGGRDRARKLEIMRDSRIGSYGVLALLIVVGLRVAAMAELATPHLVVPALIGLAMVSRAGLALWLAVLPPARDDGLGRSAAQVRPVGIAVALIAGLAGMVALLGAGGLVLALVVLAAGALVALFAMRQIGGQTGDVLGAIQQLSEVAGWLALLVLV
ncbi:adenosylcobinamide-GDP ribazoletransferase [Actibacterium sp. XHP0104]|uniref:adenosylcobinamide-GDP ribazoletransferase n=1 Tax=Actibacterium sp. XHP0104 TaxID=2984335 RepID=UPI0021E6F4B3|nr:adenosylcobinamide-GDP ribazoletransferase [Actibacterium sp. XHP0104]MCV2882729.1 adenosylcobinamide-GDP ribazoletransferase [Actibacterium sp. XHP0104]